MQTWMRGRREMKINVETIAKCGGSCGGCMLTQEERTGGTLLPQAGFAGHLPFVQAMVSSVGRDGDYTEVSINLGPADHLLAPPERADEVVRWLKEAGGGRVAGFITASAVGKTERLKRAVDAWRAAVDRHRQAVCVDMVFDPSKTRLSQFHEQYAENISYIRAAFGAVDLNINVGPDTIEAVSPEALHAFMRENGFGNLTLNLIPTPQTAERFAESWDAVTGWMVETMRAWCPDDRHGFNSCTAIAPYLEAADELLAQEDFVPRLTAMIAEKASTELLLGPDGSICFSQAGFGDTPFAARFGFAPAASTAGDPSDVRRRIRAAAERFAARTVGAFLSTRACAACPHMAVCPRTGLGVARRVMGGKLSPDASGCPLRIRPALDAMKEFMAVPRDMTTYDVSTSSIYVPAGFDTSLLPHAVAPPPNDAKVTFGPMGAV